MNEIEVKVSSHGRGRAFYIMYYDDPITGKRVKRSTKESKRIEAERAAGKWESELREGRYKSPCKITWAEFREQYEDEKYVHMKRKSQESCDTALRAVEKYLNPQMLGAISTQAISKMVGNMRRSGMGEPTITAHLRRIRAAINWAVKKGLLPVCPEFDIQSKSSGKLMRGRPICAEEFDRMLSSVGKVRKRDPMAWKHYLNGLWLSGLRLEESLILSWDQDEPFCIDLGGRHPRFRIYAEAHKSGRDILLPMTPDFAQFILQTPEAERQGPVFKLGNNRGGQLSTKRVSRYISAIGEKAGVIVNPDGKFASAHDLRRSFGTRWSSRVKPPILMKLMRHSSIETTMRYYVDHDADDIGDMLQGLGESSIPTFVPTEQNSDV